MSIRMMTFPQKLERGAWNFMAMEITTNSTSSASNGRIRAWQGNKLSPVIDIKNKKMIGSGTPQIDRLKFEVFMGGHGVERYSPESDQTISFANVFVGTGKW